VLTAEQHAKVQKLPRWASLLVAKLASEVNDRRQLDSEPAPENSAIWMEPPIIPGTKPPYKPLGTKRDSVVLGSDPDIGWHVRLVGDELEVSLWSGRISLLPQGGCNGIRIRKEV
jgi:hypothetical protein